MHFPYGRAVKLNLGAPGSQVNFSPVSVTLARKEVQAAGRKEHMQWIIAYCMQIRLRDMFSSREQQIT